jgi:DDE superfamily endonuclease
VTRPPAPEPADLRQTNQSLDLTLGGRGGIGQGHSSSAGQRRGDSARAPAAWRQVATRQALDHQARPSVRPATNPRDRLLRLAATHPTWALGCGDEVWWRRLAQPALHSWAPAAQALHLVENTRPPADRDPKALACSGLLVRATSTTPEQVWLRFATGQPVSGLTTQLLAWCSDRLGGLGKRARLLVWDHASWHTSQAVRTWLRAHNRRVQQTGCGVRLIACRLPSKSPWLNPIEPKWVHGKRAVVEPDHWLRVQELADRVCAYYGCAHEAHRVISEKAA